MSDPSKSPCVDVCDLSVDGYCVGCFRSLDEIAAWSGASDSERTQIIVSSMIRELEAVP